MTDHNDVAMDIVGVDNKGFNGDTAKEKKYSFKEPQSGPPVGVVSSDKKASGNGGGCYVNTRQGCLLLLAALIVAALVGVLVYFLHPDKDKTLVTGEYRLHSLSSP